MPTKILSAPAVAAWFMLGGVAQAQSMLGPAGSGLDAGIGVDGSGLGLSDNDITTDYDNNGDGVTDRGEFAAGTRTTYDRNQDGLLDGLEFDRFNRTLGGGAEEFGAWDTDASGFLGADEWNAGVGGSSIYDDWSLGGSSVLDENAPYTGGYGSVGDSGDLGAVGGNTGSIGDPGGL